MSKTHKSRKQLYVKTNCRMSFLCLKGLWNMSSGISNPVRTILQQLLTSLFILLSVNYPTVFPEGRVSGGGDVEHDHTRRWLLWLM